MSDRRSIRSIGEHERELAERMFRDHGHRLAEYQRQERAEMAATAAGQVSGAGRFAAEMDKRARLRREIGRELRQPLHRGGLTDSELLSTWNQARHQIGATTDDVAQLRLGRRRA